ncbi:WD40/YVTN/BNR-like repeat-containing protein [Flavihumibacter profundi]|uniref:WD40/YVTN/BNR-like repeat-containing protein n=1 Tax=Flavihumibacter profundi TaxID=2716883 RepID=UPI001CC3CF63|nr:hypothetical protein [Flavihumibacter profundi]MBZ5857958.1 hypothetical protein [Flavihumibacter profundi]
MKQFFLLLSILVALNSYAQPKKKTTTQKSKSELASADAGEPDPAELMKAVKWRNIGPFRGGRSVAVSGVKGNDQTYYMGTTGGGVWKTTDGGQSWVNISDGFFTTGSVGAIAVSASDPNIVVVGMGEHAPRGVMTSYGDGVYKSTDAGKTWKKIGLELTRQISAIRIHPTNPDIIYVAAQGAINGPTKDRGIYMSTDGGVSWKNILYVDENTGCADLSMDMTNPRILYAAMWEYHRLPWEIKSGGPGSNLYKSTDGGLTWAKLENGLPAQKGKMAIEVCRSNPNKVYALVESDTQKELGGLFASYDAGKSFNRVSKDHRLTQRAWYYIEIAVDPKNDNVLYVFNSPGLKSDDGGKTWSYISGTHGDFHQLWINPDNPENMIIANDGGAAVSFNGGKIWSTQDNQPTAQFYRVNADNRFPYYLYAGQQDNTSVMIASRNPGGYRIGEREWTFSAGGESAFLAFDPDNPKYVMGGSYQGTIDLHDQDIKEGKGVMVAPIQYQSLQPKNMKYRFNWNAPIIWSMHEPNTFYHAGNRLFKTSNMGKSWTVVSPDLTRHDTAKMGMSGIPYTNEGAGGENYATLAYVKESPHEKGVIWTGSDDGLVYLTRDNGANWANVTPAGLPECLVNSIEVSPHDKATAYIACTRYKWNDYSPMLFRTTDYGKTWTRINNGIAPNAYTRVIREDDQQKGLLYAGTETGFYISFNSGDAWTQLQLNLPVTPITDLKVHQGNLLASTMGRAFWILDDLYMLRNFAAIKSGKAVQFYGPASVYRTSGGSILDGPSHDEEEGASAAFSGVNAPSGAVFYYYIPKGSDSLRVSLTITNEKGETVRSFADSANPKFVGFPGGPSPEPTLVRKAGLNRFVWDQRYPILPGVPTVFIEGSYEGHKSPPGKYTATLKVGTTVQKWAFTILPDPRIKAATADYQEQHEYLTRTENGVRDIHQSVLKMRVAKDQVTQLISVIGNDDRYTEAKKSAQALLARMNKWEDELVQNKAQSNDDIINYINRLSADYIFLKGEMDVNIPFVTDGQKEQLNVLDGNWKPLKDEYDGIVKSGLAELNAVCRKLGIERVIMPSE